MLQSLLSTSGTQLVKDKFTISVLQDKRESLGFMKKFGSNRFPRKKSQLFK